MLGNVILRILCTFGRRREGRCADAGIVEADSVIAMNVAERLPLRLTLTKRRALTAAASCRASRISGRAANSALSAPNG
jgi:hypothetical protein